MIIIVTMSLPSDVYTELNAKWEVGVIAKPKFIEEWAGLTTKEANSITYNWMPGDFDFVTDELDDIQNNFQIGLAANSDANLLLMLSEVRRIAREKAVTNGRWHIHDFTPTKRGHVRWMILTLTEYLEETD